MNAEYRYLLRCMRGFVIGKNPGSYSGSWNALLELAKRNSVLGILGYMVTEYETGAPERVTAYLREQTSASCAYFTERVNAMRALIREMDEAGIEHLPIKGYVIRECYSVPELRSFGDIDFLIHPEDRERSDTLMKRLGFVCEENWEPVYSYKRGTEYYEIHTRAMDAEPFGDMDIETYTGNLWQHSVCVQGKTRNLSPEDHLVYLIVHIAKHLRGSGAGIRMYLDIAFMLKRYSAGMDWRYVHDELKQFGLTEFSNTVFVVASTVLGGPAPEGLCPMDKDLLIEFMTFTLSGGTFGFADKEHGETTLKRSAGMDGTLSRGRTLLGRLFPSAASIETRYTYLQKHPWLLPAAWIHRFFRTLGSLPVHMAEARGIMTVDEEKVSRMRRLSEKIGLNEEE